MDRTPSQIFNYLSVLTDSNGNQLCTRSGGRRYSFYINGRVIVNHVVPTSSARNARGYILLRDIPDNIKNRWSEFEHAGRTSIGINHFEFNRFHHLLTLLIT